MSCGHDENCDDDRCDGSCLEPEMVELECECGEVHVFAADEWPDNCSVCGEELPDWAPGGCSDASARQAERRMMGIG